MPDRAIRRFRWSLRSGTLSLVPMLTLQPDPEDHAPAERVLPFSDVLGATNRRCGGSEPASTAEYHKMDILIWISLRGTANGRPPALW